MPYPERSVLVVGGGIVGLSMAAFLAQRGVEVVLVERRAAPSTRLRAKLFYARTIEMYRSIGLEKAIVDATPPQGGDHVAIVRSLAGEEVRRWRLPTAGGSVESPCLPSTIKQHDLEIIVRDRAIALGADLRFGHRLIGFDRDAEGVTATISGPDAAERTIRAACLIGCDGARSGVRDRLGIGRSGRGDLIHAMGISVRADLSAALRGRPLAFAYVRRDDLDAYVAWEADTGRAAVSVTYDPATTDIARRFDRESARALAASCLGLPAGDIEVLETYPWNTSAWVADRYAAGRVYLAGDAAHSVPPHGGFGANTGIHDAHNLAHKLADVLLDSAPERLLSTYERERRPIAEMVAAQALSRSAGRVGARLPAATIEPLLAEDAIMMGYRYAIGERSGASPPNPIAFPPEQLHGEVGTRAPHVRLERGGSRISSLDLFGRRPVLLAGSSAASWARRAAARLRDDGRQCECVIVGQDVVDPDQAFEHAFRLAADGAALVRTDGFVAWRAIATEMPVDDAVSEMLLQLGASTGRQQPFGLSARS